MDIDVLWWNHHRELWIRTRSCSYRTVYTVRFEEGVYALDAFQKKSKKGIATSKADLDRIKARLKRAEEMHAEWLKEREGDGKAKG